MDEHRPAELAEQLRGSIRELTTYTSAMATLLERARDRDLLPGETKELVMAARGEAIAHVRYCKIQRDIRAATGVNPDVDGDPVARLGRGD
jgi:hypothetical protein